MAILFHATPPIARDRLQRQVFSAMPPLFGLSLDCDRLAIFMERSGGVAAIVCDTTGNTV